MARFELSWFELTGVERPHGTLITQGAYGHVSRLRRAVVRGDQDDVDRYINDHLSHVRSITVVQL